MRFLRLLVVTLVLAAFSLQARPARALATGTLTYSPPIWSGKTGERATNLINRQDCLNDAKATFSVKILGALGNFEVWAGANCDMVVNRNPTSTSPKTCVKVFASDSNQKAAEIHVRDMVSPYASTNTPGAPVSACDSTEGFGALARSLYFLVVNPSDLSSIVTMPTPWQFSYDIVPPAAPSNVTAQPGDQTLVTSFTPPTNETRLLRYHFYCSPASSAPASTGGSGGTDAAGTAGTAGTDTAGTDTGGTAGTDTAGTAGTDAASTGGIAGMDTGGSSGSAGTAGSSGSAGTPAVIDPNCTSSILIPGQPPPADAISCGDIPGTGTTGGEGSPSLENGTTYAIAVASEDEVSNVGPLSNLACGTPRDVTGFYEAYRRAGGEGGGGYCTFAPARRGELAGIIALALGACALVRRRR